MIYLDNAATTPIDPVVLDAMMPYLKDQFGNAGTLYRIGRQAKTAIEKARLQVAEFIGAKPEQVIFTSGGTESNNMVFNSASCILRLMGKTEMAVSTVEHDSVLKAARRACSDGGLSVNWIPVDKRGCVEVASLKSVIGRKTGLVSVMYMNNETGAENPVDEIGELCEEHGILFHTDCVQAAGCCNIDVERIGCDFLSLSSHKIHGPKGTGALFVRNPDGFDPLIIGGATQEFGLRGGTENVAGIVGFGAACQMMTEHLHEIDIHTSTLKQVFYNELTNRLDRNNLGHVMHVNGDLVIKHGKTINLRFEGVDAETLLILLDSRDIFVSAGSACRSNESEPSHVLTAMGLSAEDARNSIRVSFSKMSTEEEARIAAKEIAECVVVLHR